jgi:hypothetical protein
MSLGIIALHNHSESFFLPQNRLTGTDCFLRDRRAALPRREWAFIAWGRDRMAAAVRAQRLAPRQRHPAGGQRSWSPTLQLP